MGRGGLIFEGAHNNKKIRARFSIMGCFAIKTYANFRVRDSIQRL
jgi:hypothetical protein